MPDTSRPPSILSLDAAVLIAYGENFQDADGNLFHFNLR